MSRRDERCPCCGAPPCHQKRKPVGGVADSSLLEYRRECRMVEVDPGQWECDACGSSIDWDGFDEPPHCNYCPNCGAKVVEG